MKIITLAGFAALAWLAGAAQAVEYGQFVPAQSRVAFVSKQMGVPVDGQFGKFNLQLNFDPARPEAAKALLEIDLASVDAGSREANEEVVGKNWFNVRQFPTARFESSGLRHLGGNRYEVRGRMTLKGRSREMAAPVTFATSGRNGILEGGFILKRLEWGIGEGPWGDPGTVADEVQIKFRFTVGEASPAKPAQAGQSAR
jgi:polyisoprenoid-binding protein YceI